jgi:hypothetical protein
MKKYRKKPYPVDAEQWFPDHPVEGVIPSYPCSGAFSATSLPQNGWLTTPKGDLLVHPGDWIITEPGGVKSRCPADLFEKFYEPVQEGL